MISFLETSIMWTANLPFFIFPFPFTILGVKKLKAIVTHIIATSLMTVRCKVKITYCYLSLVYLTVMKVAIERVLIDTRVTRKK